MERRNSFYSTLAILFVILFFFGCSYSSKESYLSDYESFMSDVSQNYKNYGPKDWAEKSAKYKKFSGEWYEKFKDDFTTKEKVILAGYQVKFNYYYMLKESTDVIDGLLKTMDAEKIKSQAQYYIENDMQDDLKKLYEEAKRTNKKAEKMVSDIYDDLKINIEELN